MLEFAAAKRAENIEVGRQIERAAQRGGSNNGSGFHLPSAAEMAEYCHDRFNLLTSDWQREFIFDIFALTRGIRTRLSPRRLGSLMKTYVELGGPV